MTDPTRPPIGTPPPVGKPKLSFQEQLRLNKLKAEQDKLRFTIIDIGGDDLGKAPFNNQGMHVAEYSLQWWFEYFWAEAKMSAGAGEKQTLADIANAVFEKTPDGPAKYKLRPELERWTDKTRYYETWRECLTKLLYLGFRCMDRTQVTSPGPNLPPVNGVATEHLGLQREFFRYIEAKKEGEPRFDDKVEVYYRSETRDIGTIVSHQGTRRQIDVGFLAKSMNMSADWHPFSVAEIKDKMWFRRGNADNDYFTVISVAKDFETCLAFPKIDEQRVYSFPTEPIEQWKPQQLDYYRKNLATVRLSDGSTKVVVVTQTTAYMCAATGAVLDTVRAGGAGGESFPEQGLADIPLDQIFAAFPVNRYHHGHMDPKQGFTAYIDYARAKTLKDTSQAMDLYGAAFEGLWDIYMKWKYHAPIVTAWSKTGAAAPSVNLQISNVIANPIDPETLQQLKANAGSANPSVGQQMHVHGQIKARR
ncbi:MAG TPA: hypothetical protein VIC55_11835 [Gemmatimonadaceae bacterium]